MPLFHPREHVPQEILLPEQRQTLVALRRRNATVILVEAAGDEAARRRLLAGKRNRSRELRRVAGLSPFLRRPIFDERRSAFVAAGDGRLGVVCRLLREEFRTKEARVGDVTNRRLRRCARGGHDAGSVAIPVGRRHDRHAVGIGDAEVDRRAACRELTEPVVGEQRQVGLPGAVVDHAQDTLVGVDIRRRPPVVMVAATGLSTKTWFPVPIRRLMVLLPCSP